MNDERVIQFATWIIITLLGIISYLLLNWITTSKKNNEDKLQSILDQFVKLREADIRRFEDYMHKQDKMFEDFKLEVHKFNDWIKDYIHKMDEQERWQTEELQNHHLRINNLEK